MNSAANFFFFFQAEKSRRPERVSSEIIRHNYFLPSLICVLFSALSKDTFFTRSTISVQRLITDAFLLLPVEPVTQGDNSPCPSRMGVD